MAFLLFLAVLVFSMKAVQGQQVDDVLTVAQRIEIFGTNSSIKLPPLEYVSLQRLAVSPTRTGRKRPVNLERYALTYNGQRIVFTLKLNKDLLAPGCMVHHNKRGGEKIVYPCDRSMASCMFAGHSDTHNNTWAAVNTCRGMKGIVNIENKSLIIAPLHSKAVGNYDNSVKTHVVYRYTSDKSVFMDGQDPAARLHIIRRNKRAVADAPRFVETRVTVDQSVHVFHGNESEKYVQTIFNIASKLFEDTSLDSSVKLCLSEIRIYESYDDIGTRLSKDALKTLNNFCMWQAENYTTTTDANILLTRIDIAYRSDDTTVGLAHPSGMCQMKHNCAVVEDTGPASGVILAHEMGHLVGMLHDNATSCHGEVGIMGRGITGENAFHWSSCSRDAARQFLSNHAADCLLNKPAGQVGYDSSAPMPGTIFTREDQCRMTKSKEASYCPVSFVDVCDKLTCRPSSSEGCVVQGSTIIDGTDCNNTRTWCMSGRCVPVDSSVRPVHGQWSAWHEEPCSRTCGGGVKVRQRTCTNPAPQFGGRDCDGIGVNATICNMESCLSEYKEEQCNDFVRNRPNMIEKSGWTPLLVIGNDSCLIRCESPSGQSIQMMDNGYKTRGIYYRDGTECLLHDDVPFARCVHGQCKKFGCDGKMDSNRSYDNCGVCNGNNAGCQRSFGVYTKDEPAKVFTTAVGIPKDSYNVKVSQNNGYCFLSVLVNGKRAFNQNQFHMSSGIYIVDGVRIQYTKTPESLKITGRITADVEIQVYRKYSYLKYAGVSPDMKYEYYRRQPNQALRYTWSKQLSDCSEPCGTGFQTRIITCVDLSFGIVDNSLCDIGTKPSEVREPCNTHQCIPDWETSYPSKCSVSCGPGGIRTRQVFCATKENGSYKHLPDDRCDYLPLKPNNTEACSDNPCPPVWRAGRWSECSKSCSEGFQLRPVQCYLTNGTNVPDRLCDVEKRPALIQTCSKGICLKIYGTLCKDITSNCKHNYGDDICYGTYKKWAERNCSKECGLCSGEDNPLCATLAGRGTNICKLRPRWSGIHCPEMCKYPDCFDQPQCSGFANAPYDPCTHADFRQNVCPRMCKTCGAQCDDTDDCSRYSHDTCTNSIYIPYMTKHCPKYCGLC